MESPVNCYLLANNQMPLAGVSRLPPAVICSINNHPPQHFGAVVVVLHRVLDEAEAVDVADKGVAVGSEQVEAAHSLLQTGRQFVIRNVFLLMSTRG